MELQGISSCQFAGSLENALVSDQFGQKPNVGRNHQKISADQIPPALLWLRGECCGGTVGLAQGQEAWQNLREYQALQAAPQGPMP